MSRFQAMRRVLSHPSLVLGGLIVLLFLAVAAAAPLIAPPEGRSPYLLPKEGFGHTPKPPDAEHPLGTLAGQYDVFYGLVWGTRIALWVGLSVTLGRALLGVVLGLVSGHHGGTIDALIMRVTDAFMAFPIMAAAMVIIVVFSAPWWETGPTGPASLSDSMDKHIALALILFGWMPYARLIRGNVLAERDKEYIQAAVSLGAPGRRILLRHLLPNVTQGLLVLVTSDIGTMVVLMATFNFLGLKVTSTVEMLTDWGQMLNTSRDWIIGTPANAFEYWYTFIPASLAIVLFSMGWNLIGDGLRDVLDPRLR